MAGYLVLNLGPELLGGDIENRLRARLGDDYFPVVLGVFLVAVTATVLQGRRWWKKQKTTSATTLAAPDVLAQVRETLRAAYADRLQQKHSDKIPVQLTLHYSQEGSELTQHNFDKEATQRVYTKANLHTLFNQHQGRLLITGDPGAGKTTLLLELAQQLLATEAEQIPLVLDLATWRSHFNTLEAWWLELLPQMGYSKSLARRLVAEKRILPLLDGLDEVDEAPRGQ
ncbi:MAG TPA: hypothetical protein DCE41_02230, partial [Cytophagales bacterium]|nr:hypothetical protein [Cytophagales bacterium]